MPDTTNLTMSKKLIASVILGFLVLPLATASPLTPYTTYGCVVEASSALDPENGVTQNWTDAPKSFSLIEKDCFVEKSRELITPDQCSASVGTYLEIGPTETVLKTFAGGSWLLGSVISPNRYVGVYNHAVGLSFASDSRVIISIHPKLGNEQNVILVMTANCFVLG